MSTGDLVYRSVARLAPLALRVAAPFDDKARRGVAGRRDTLASMLDWAARHRDPDRPLVWLHAPSVGEALMAQSILGAVREIRPETQAAFTFFSPSTERMAGRVGADWHGYLPWDIEADIGAALDALRPSQVAFVRTEIWPVLLAAARDRRARVVLVNAVLAESSSRNGRGARFLLGHAYSRLDALGAVTAEDGRRFTRLGVPEELIRVTGDARFDQVWQRIAGLEARPLLTRVAATSGSWLVAGSTWEPDEAVLLEGLTRLRERGAPWRMIMAPHEPSSDHVTGLERRVEQAGLSHARLPALEDTGLPAADVLVVDRVGILAELYAVAHVAWVGGGFGSAGLHSVVEPAALGVPVLFGPRHGNAGEAARLVAAGGGAQVSSTSDLVEVLQNWTRPSGGPSPAGTAAAAAARAFVSGQLGGARLNAELILA
ncbi:MAG TPA: glycosyltransferase N-terminal domain-containing protein [Longimicrobiales bacterium]|nr:glycosyltransferase N-terminal domain-containing protein [Longimicrobiales bacterium]